MSMFQIPGTATNPKSLGLSEWPDIEPLLDKAINSPSEITQEEKHKIAEWIPSREQMEARTRKYLNRSLDELCEVGATDRDSLTYPDCLMILQGFNLLRRRDHVGREMEKLHRAELYSALQAKWEQAKAAFSRRSSFMQSQMRVISAFTNKGKTSILVDGGRSARKRGDARSPGSKELSIKGPI